MRRRTAALARITAGAVLLLGVAAGPLAAQGFPRWGLGVAGGVGIPVGDYGDVLETGPLVEITGEYFASPSLSIGLQAGFASLPPQDAFAPPNLDTRAQVSEILLLGRYQLAGEGFRPYASLGFGAMNRSIELTDPYGSGSSSQTIEEKRTNFGAAGGIGGRVPLSPGLDLLPEVGLLVAFLTDDPILQSSTQATATAKVGLRYRFGS